MRARKRKHEQVVRTTISLPPAIYDIAHQQQRLVAYSNFSRYIEELIRADRSQNILQRLTA